VTLAIRYFLPIALIILLLVALLPYGERIGLWTWEMVYPLEKVAHHAGGSVSSGTYSWKVVSFVRDPELSAHIYLQLLFGFVLLMMAAVWAHFHAASKIRELEQVGQIRRNEEKFHALFSTMAEGFALHEIITDSQGEAFDYRFLEVNPAFEALTGKCAAEIVGKTLLEVFPASEKVWIERYGQVALSGTSDRFSEYSKETGRAFEVSAYSPAPGQFACVFSDVTVNRHLEEQLRQSQKMESIGTLAGGVAHDFNNILTVIMGAGAMLQMKLESDAELGPFVRQILSSSERAAKLTHNLLAFSRKQTIKPVKVDMNDVVGIMRDFLGRIIGEDVTLKTTLCSGTLPVCADRSQLEQVLMNLAVNARDAMPNGGTLTLETALVHSCDHSLELEGCCAGDYALISVSDSGFGMDSTTSSRIFEPFFTTKEIGYGTGLGLSMAYGIIKQHEGTIKVYSELGEGTVFKIFLPLQMTKAAIKALPVDRPLPGGTETVMLVEDDPEVRSSNSAVLECVGYNVIVASCGEEAIALFEHYCNTISLVILDVIMPGMNGRDVNEFLKALRPNVKVLFVSGYTADILNRKGVLSEDTNFLSKPLEPHLFLGKVRELIDG
jgi:PAS domain S-box-containing protein